MTDRSAMNRRFLRFVGFGTLLSLTLVLAACGALRDDKGRPLTTLNPKGIQSTRIDNLVSPVFIVATVVFVLVEGGVLFMVFRFRRRKDAVDGVDEPVQVHGIPRLEWAWTILPALLLAGMAILNVKTIWQLEERDSNAITVEVYGQQWWWEFRYDTNDDGKPDIITANQMVIPAGRQMNLVIRSNDVIHSFWIPALNGKKDAVPGRTHSWSLEADKPGLYQGTCTEFCGLSHAYMRMEVKAVTPTEYKDWITAQEKPATLPTDATPNDASDDSAVLKGYGEFKAQCAQCHQINGLGYDKKPTDGTPDPKYGGVNHPLTSGNAPNLTHLMSRNRFAGNLLALYTDDTRKEVNVSNLGNWLRNPKNLKPMAPDENRGMPNLNLSQDQIDNLVAFLSTLK
ncbi:MAG: cytochrome c oxidase subunit II [Acidimicrobiales bacterium]